MVGHHDTMIEAVLVEPFAGLSYEADSIRYECALLAVLVRREQHRGRQLRLAESARGRHHHALVPSAERGGNVVDNCLLLGAKF